MSDYLTDEQIDALDVRTWGSGGRLDVTPEEAWSLVKEVRNLRGQRAMLADAVVMAANLYFGNLKNPREEDYASEALYEAATQAAKDNPRLKGVFPTGEER